MTNTPYKRIGPQGNKYKIKYSYPRRPVIFRLLNLAVRYFPADISYRNNSILLVKRLNGEISEYKPDNLEFKWAGDDELEYIGSHVEARNRHVYQNRLENDHRCFCMLDNNEVIGFNWFAFHKCCHLCGSGYEFEFYPLRQDQAFTYDFYIYNRYRGQKFGKLLKKQLLLQLLKDNVCEVFTLVEPSNEISMKVHLSLDYRPVCMVYSYRFMSWRRSFLNPSGAHDSLNKWVDDFIKYHSN